MLPVDVRGTPRCPSCFRKLRRIPWMDATCCPSLQCPLEYVIDSMELFNARR